MKVSSQNIEGSQVLLQIEVGAKEMESAFQETYHQLAQRVNIPGFRKGKIPYEVLENYLGREAILERTLEHLIPKVYSRAIKEQGIKAIAQPRIEIVESNPLVFKATVPISPVVRLGNYHNLKVTTDPVTVTEEQLEAVLERVRHQQAIWHPVERAVKETDMVTMDMEGELQGKTFLSRRNADYQVIKQSPFPVPGFAEKLEGMEKGEERSFSLSYPADYPEVNLAGKEYFFKVKIHGVKERELPELDDELAKRFGHENLASLKEEIEASLKARAEEESQRRLEEKVIDALVDLAQVEYSPLLVEREVDHLLEDQARYFGGAKGLEDYLRNSQKTLESLKEELRPVAAKRLVRSLVLDKLAEVENIEVDPREIDLEIENLKKRAGQSVREAEKFFTSPRGRDLVKQSLLRRKSLAKLLEIATK